jgi:PAS domain S-box-containing protein
MTHQTRSWRSAASALLPLATAALATGIFIAEAITPMKLTIAVFYVIVVLLAARFCSARGIVLVGAGCVGLTMLAFFLPGFTETEAGGVGVKASISAAVIGVATFLVTERQHAMEALLESEKQWREVFDHNPVMYFMLGPTGTVLSANAFAAAQLGYAAAELIGHSVLSVFLEEDREGVKGQLATCVEELGRSHSWEIRKIRKDGTVLWVRENAKAVRRSGNDVIVLIACEDITERRRGEQRAEAQYAVTRVLAEADSLATAAPHILQAIGENLEWDWGALWSFDREGASLRCDCLWHAPDIETVEFDTVSRERSFRVREGRLGQVWRSASPSWIIDATNEPGFVRASAASQAGLHGGVIFRILLDTEALGVIEFFSLAPRERDLEQLATLSAIGSQIGQFIKRRSAEAALRANEERWRKLFETSAAGMALARLDGVFTAANPALQRMLGRTEEEILGRSAVELNPQEERAATADALAKFRSGSLTERQVEKKYLKKDGSPVWLNITTTVVPATETATPFLQAVYMDITSRVQFEAALRASEERWRAMFETSVVGIITFGSEHRRYVTANESFQRMTGYTEDELRNLTPLDITHEDDRAMLQEHVDQIVAGRQRSYRIEKRYRRKDGEIVWADVNSFVVRVTDSSPAFLAVMVVDITDRKRAEEALQQAQADLARLNRVMLLGEMTASIAHEINQPIAAVITNANAGLRWLGAPQPDLDEVRQALGRIVRDGTRAGEVIGRIRALVKKLPPRRDFSDINEAISEVIALTQAEMQRNRVRLESRLADDLPLVSADRVQLQQVMINLIVNAIEAMGGMSGRLRELTIVSGRDDSKDVFVEVQDTGPGLSPEKLDRLFQSFYTTKPDGIGMGLAISRSIAEAHGGRLSAAPNKPRGAVFRFTLPVEEAPSRTGRSDP